MGYTHYWHRQGQLSTLAGFALYAKDVERLIKSSNVVVALEYDEPETPPHLDLNAVQFNGVGKDGHETFYLAREGEEFTFCKTGQKPYDLLVTAALIVAKKHFETRIRITSDGEDGDWDEARDLCSRVLGYGDTFHLSEDGDHALEEQL